MQEGEFDFTLHFTGNINNKDWNNILKEFIIQEMANTLCTELVTNKERLW